MTRAGAAGGAPDHGGAGGRGPSFGALLRGHRRAAGLTQEALAERAGLSRRGIQHLEAGDERPYPATLEALAAALALAPEDRARLRAMRAHDRPAAAAVPAAAGRAGQRLPVGRGRVRGRVRPPGRRAGTEQQPVV